MRNVLLLLILTIFIFSIFSLEWKSLLEAKTKPEEKGSTSRVEKLVKGDDKSGEMEKYEIPEPSRDEYFRPEKMPETQKDEVEVKFENKNLPDSNNQISQTQTQTQTLPTTVDVRFSDIIPEQLDEINNDLRQKYNNNPEAEVSEEDLFKIMERILQPQNR